MKELLDMSEDELLKTKAKIEILLGNKSKSDLSYRHGNVEIFYEILSHYLQERLQKSQAPLGVLAKTRGNEALFKKITTMNKDIDEWIDSILKHPTRMDRIKIYQMTFELIGKWLKKNKRMLSLLTLVYNHNLFPGIFDRAYPGYVEAGLFKMILRAKPHKFDKEDLI